MIWVSDVYLEMLRTENKVLKEALFHENTEREKAEAERDALQETITACEHEVAEVYSVITCGKFAKMNTKASAILDEWQTQLMDDIDEAVKEATTNLERDKESFLSMGTNWYTKYTVLATEFAKLAYKKWLEIESCNENIKMLQGEIEYLTLSKQEWMDKYYKLAEKQEKTEARIVDLESQNTALNIWIRNHIELLERLEKEGKL